ncbi:hypothetical protein [Variovorax sp.]|jgi:hypothetical protein|uniref:hypothetical protein n=1 Tax=Variovorax sp. TaxID=1871043 RepID=UPI000C57F10D|nr:hypothetical protein [Variovorax sp.]MBS78257.1 hypothetical protein [Variovorax sp.]
MSTRKSMSPENIDQNREAGIDTPADGSRIGREAKKPSGGPGERGHDPAPPARAAKQSAPPASGKDNA